MVGRARTLIVVAALTALAVGVFALPGIAIFAVTSNSSTADLLVDRPEIAAGMGFGTLLALMVLCLVPLMRVGRARAVSVDPPDPAVAAAAAEPPAGA